MPLKLLISCNFSFAKLNHQPQSLMSFLSESMVSDLCTWTLNSPSNFLFFFNLALDLVNSSPYNYMFFTIWSMVLDFFNEVHNWPSYILIIKPLICLIKPPKKPIKSLEFTLFQLSPKLTPKIDFPCNKALNKIN